MSTTLIIWFILLTTFFIFLIYTTRRFKNATLEKTPLDPDEKILFEDEIKKTESQTGPRPLIYPKCVVRVTNKRILVGQKFLFSKKKDYALKYVMYYGKDRAQPLGYAGGAMKNGFISFTVDKKQLKASADEHGEYVELKPESTPGPRTGIPYYVRLYTTRYNDYAKL